MNRVLFDTNIVSYWHAGDQRFKPPLHRLLGELRRDKTASYLSAITIQELGQWALFAGNWPALNQFMSAARLNVLPFCSQCALQAAKLQAAHGPVVAKKSEREEMRAGEDGGNPLVTRCKRRPHNRQIDWIVDRNHPARAVLYRLP